MRRKEREREWHYTNKQAFCAELSIYLSAGGLCNINIWHELRTLFFFSGAGGGGRSHYKVMLHKHLVVKIKGET